MICVRTMPGHRTDTPIARGASVTRSPSDSATTPYFVTLYEGFAPEISPAMDAVETICPPSPCASMSGPKISIPQITDIRLTPRVPTCIGPMAVAAATANPRIVDQNMDLTISRDGSVRCHLELCL